MTHGNRRLDIVLAVGLAALVLVPWYRIEGGFYGLGWLAEFPLSKAVAPGILQMVSEGRVWLFGVLAFFLMGAVARSYRTPKNAVPCW